MHTKDNPSKRALILGAAGFIGSHLVQRLNAGNEFTHLALAGHGVAQKYYSSNMMIFDGLIDSNMLNQCPTPDVILFAAGSASVGASIENPTKDFKLSIPSLVDLLDKLRTNWPRSRLVYISSAAVYGESSSIATPTQSQLLPLSPYGLHKKISEELILFELIRNRLDAVIVRPFSIYGPGLKKQLLWDALNKAQLGHYSFFGTGNEMRDWIFVDDLVSLLVDISLYPERFPTILNIGTGIPVSVANILRKLYTAFGIWQSPTFVNVNKAGDPCDLSADPMEQTPYSSYFKTPLDKGLQHYVNWFRSIQQ
ncbi:NAD-dependent epimerase/dehydratase family protein [Methylomonas rapida]|uniref:SDR family oxidoreductase n=1 Tax=Methylomonas rapida TaxID=2963939 RepID=A0ABY7GGZ9_9GAMM|nr:SDR family oxidoreductase [Methylomonas rapida]WAR44089.1 SDR family oxidoreductase [Methylomonas rapida]